MPEVDMNSFAAPLPLGELFAGRHVLVTGVSGFLGKVFLTRLLARFPDIARVYVLIRPKDGESGAARLERLFNESYGFAPLHETHGAGLSAFLSRRVQALEGD